MSNLSLNVGISNAPKEYAARKAQTAPPPQQEALRLTQALRESGFEWQTTDNADHTLKANISDFESLLTSTATDTSARVSRSGLFSQEMLVDLKSRFQKMFVSSYGNVFSHNRLLAKVAEWMVGNVMEQLALMGMSLEELNELKTQVRADLIDQNRSSMEQVIYDETMLEIIG
ncbi:hypothetical protein HZB07_01890 [Candidatus Saganbacteria bacterium]|nr:hypothetical protein [Candidatus Saganbacteria bacterium]